MSEVREAIASATRIVVKVGSSSLTSEVGGMDEERISAIVANVASRCARGTEVVLVSSGAIATGFPTLGLTRRPQDLATQQASASVGQGMLLAHYTRFFAEHGLDGGSGAADV